MSNTRRARPRRNGRKYHDMWDAEIAAVTGWCNGPDTLDDVKQVTHDAVIRLAGDRRCGGVSWRILDVPAEALDLLAQLRAASLDNEEMLDVYDKCTELVTEHGGILVIATAPWRPFLVPPQ